jgi:hypothetical protein
VVLIDPRGLVLCNPVWDAAYSAGCRWQHSHLVWEKVLDVARALEAAKEDIDKGHLDLAMEGASPRRGKAAAKNGGTNGANVGEDAQRAEPGGTNPEKKEKPAAAGSRQRKAGK